MSDDSMTDEKQVRVLVIDDEDIVHASIRKILRRFGYEVDGVFSAAEGLERLGAEHFDLAIVDLMMPKMNGIEFLEEFGKLSKRPPVLMVTGYPTIGTAVKALRLGAVDYIAKPFTRKELFSPVQRALAQAGEAQEPAQQVGKPMDKDSLVPGSVVVLPRHAWAEFQQDGTFLIGVEESFMRSVTKVHEVSIPEEMDIVEQGYIGVYIKNENNEEHGVAMPLSGQIVASNKVVREDSSKLDTSTWLLRIIPSHLDEELGRLAIRTAK